MITESEDLGVLELRMFSLAVARWEERLFRRMLTAWDPAWGRPEIIGCTRPAPDYRKPAYTLSSDPIIGLAKYGVPEGGYIQILVYAGDHVDADNQPLPALPLSPEELLARLALIGADLAKWNHSLEMAP